MDFSSGCAPRTGAPFFPVVAARAASGWPSNGSGCSALSITSVSPSAQDLVPSTTGQSFPKRERIASRRDFVRIYEEGSKLFARYSVLFIAPNSLGHPRLGVTVTRKLGKAHDRNRLKRWVREAYRRRRTPLGLDSCSLDLVVNVKAAATGTDFADFSEDFGRALQRAVSAASGAS